MLGFVLGNLPGAAVGALAGSKLGSIRDAKGVAVYQVFSSYSFLLIVFFVMTSAIDILNLSVAEGLGSDQKAEILRGLAAKVFSMATGQVS